MDRIPHLLSRLHEPGIRYRCVEQWGQAPAHQHHRVSRGFLMPGSLLRGQVDALGDDGSGMLPELAAE
eukprot:7794262-Pyramimonas_sp.AAC.1